MRVEIPVSCGDLLDRISILEIKVRRVADPRKLDHVRARLEELRRARDGAIVVTLPELMTAIGELNALNETLWATEDELRRFERRRDFGPCFVELARSVYRTNDRRAAVKHRIDELLGSRIIEEKFYPAYE